MTITETGFEGLRILEPRVFQDPRGFFLETYNMEVWKERGIHVSFIQDNQSHSVKKVIRGLHFQKPPFAQTKLVRVIYGIILDVVVDLRSDQPTFKKSYSIELSADNHKQLLIPKGFAHGFSVLSDEAGVLYKCDEVYHPETEAGIVFNDPGLAIDWRIKPGESVVSAKDAALPRLSTLAFSF